MGIFDGMFMSNSDFYANESGDYLAEAWHNANKNIFPAGTSYIEMGIKGMAIAEAGWLEITESMKFEESEMRLNEEFSMDSAKEWFAKQGSRVKEFITVKIPNLLKKIAQVIFTTINKFLNEIVAIVKKDANLYGDKARIEAGFDRAAKDGKIEIKGGIKVAGNDPTRRIADAKNAVLKVPQAIVKASEFKGENSILSDVMKQMANATKAASASEGGTGSAIARLTILNAVRQALTGNTETNERSFAFDIRVDLAGSEENATNPKFAKADIDAACKIVKDGYKDAQKIIKAVATDAKATINEEIKNCNELGAKWDKFSKSSDNKDEDAKKGAANLAKLIEWAGKIMSSGSGILSSYSSQVCNLLKQNYVTNKKFLQQCHSYGAKQVPFTKNESTYESDVSLFGLDLL